jgi:hypothetical protein
MKPQMGMVRKKEMELGNGSGGAVGTIGARENGCADSPALLFEAVKQATRPDKFGCKNSQPEQDRQPARARRKYHHDAESKQREPDENLQEAFSLLQTPNEHSLGPLHPLRCAVKKSDAGSFPARGLPITERLADRECPANTDLSATFDRKRLLLDSNSGNFFPREG